MELILFLLLVVLVVLVFDYTNAGTWQASFVVKKPKR